MQSMTCIYRRLEVFEKSFQDKLTTLQPQIMSDILVTENEVSEIGKSLGYLIRHKKWWGVCNDFQLCTALFLVWCTVYHYKEGNLWEPVFAKLEVEQDIRKQGYLGNIFLSVLQNYKLLFVPGMGKRYMTPILMHGYISNHYVNRFLDYLNAIYMSYLNSDISDNSLENLWANLFNISEEQVSLHDNFTKLSEEAESLRTDIAKVRVSETLAEHTQMTIGNLHQESKTLQNELINIEQSLVSVDSEITDMEELNDQFLTCKQVLVALDSYQLDIDPDSVTEIVDYSAKISDFFSQSFNQLMEEKRQLQRKVHSCKNRYKIAEAKYVNVMTEIVKLGTGSVERGFAELTKYKTLQNELQKVTKQKQQLESLLQDHHDFGNTSIDQILTTSLTSLSIANPRLFQQFIRTTLEMLDAIWSGCSPDKKHRLYQSLKQWYKDKQLKKVDTIQAEKVKSTSGVGKESSESPEDLHKTRIYISQPTLQPPVIKYDAQARDLVVEIPSQKFQRPKQVKELPEYTLNYLERQEHVSVYCHNTPKQIAIDSSRTVIRDSTLQGLFFIWVSISEFWSLSVDPVVVFDEEGRLTDGKWLANGFYYIIAHNDWLTNYNQIIDSYPCSIPDYTVYEVYLTECSISFKSEQETITIHCSKISDVKLHEFKSLPGVRYEGMPVGRGKPQLLISQRLLDLSEESLTFLLDYNGGRFYEAPLDEIASNFGQQHTPETIKLALEQMVSLKRQPSWETYAVQIVNGQGQIVFSESICLVKGFDVVFQTDEVNISVPSKSILEHPEAMREAKSYLIPTVNRDIINIRVYIDRVGWKQLTIDVPGGECQLIDKDGTVMPLPLQILKSDYNKLQDLTVHFKANNALVQQVEVFDQDKYLLTKFNLAKEAVTISLHGFSDLWSNMKGDDKIYLRWKGVEDSKGTIAVVEGFHKLEITQADIFQSEQEEEYLLELTYQINFAYSGELRFRVSYQNDSTNTIFDRRIRNNPDHFYIRKRELKDQELRAEIYYIDHQKGVFGAICTEHVCWSYDIILSLREARLRKAMAQGIVLQSFLYKDERHVLPHKYHIFKIQLSPKHFEGDQLLRGVIKNEDQTYEVFFYIEDDVNLLAYLWDDDADGVQYDPNEKRLFWEMSESQDVIGPLEDLEFEFAEVAGDES